MQYNGQNLHHNQFQTLKPPSNKQINKNISHKYISSIQDKIQEQIKIGMMDIPKQIKSFQIDQHPHSKIQPKNNKQLIHKIYKQKNRIMNDLRQLQQKQISLKNDLIKSRSISPSQISHKTPQKSLYTQIQKQKIREILHSMKNKEIKSKKMHNQILNKHKSSIIQERMYQKQKIQKLKVYHQQIAQKNLHSLQMRQQKRQQFQQKIKSNTKQLKNKHYIFIERQRLDQIKKQQQNQQKQLILKKLREKKKFDINQLVEHNAKYQQIKLMKNSTLNSKKKIMTEAPSMKNYQKNKFALLIEEEQKMRKIQEKQKIQKAYENRQRMKSFADVVKERYLPKTKNINKSFQQHTKYGSTEVRQAMSPSERVLKGKQYLQIAKKNRKQKDSTRVQTQPQIVKHYQNYLNKIKLNNHRKVSTTQKFNKILKQSQKKLAQL